MSDARLIVDHQKLEYEGPFDLKGLITMIERYAYERGFDRKVEKSFENETKTGRSVEWQVAHWKKVTDYMRFVFKIRILVYNYLKIDYLSEKKKVKVGNGHIIIYFDALMELDYFHKWDWHPFFIFIRALYDKFIYKHYTERFEQRITFDMVHLYEEVEKFFNMYRHYRPVKITPHFAH